MQLSAHICGKVLCSIQGQLLSRCMELGGQGVRVQPSPIYISLTFLSRTEKIYCLFPPNILALRLLLSTSPKFWTVLVPDYGTFQFLVRILGPILEITQEEYIAQKRLMTSFLFRIKSLIPPISLFQKKNNNFFSKNHSEITCWDMTFPKK